jgi:CHAT domain-containing protein
VGADPADPYRVAGTALRRRVWDPIARHLTDVATVFVVPDGTLNLVSMAALPIGQASYLLDRGPVFHYLSAERDIVMNPSTRGSNEGLLAVGGAAFDDASAFAGAVKSTASARAQPARPSDRTVRGGCDDLSSLQFGALGGTTKEVHELARLWTESRAQILESQAATERAFKSAAPGRRVLHLATHGFFLGACGPMVAGTRSVGGLVAAPTPSATAGLQDNPLLLSGLALAGANRRKAAGPDDEDGILTAEEVAGLNLTGVEWAVLSACDTGRGEVRIGEGVFGLRRAFQMAGVHTVIMSLWSVEDQATMEWMRALYVNRVQEGLSTAEAMHAASLSVLRARRARGLTTHPFYWGGFIAAGDWR